MDIDIPFKIEFLTIKTNNFKEKKKLIKKELKNKEKEVLSSDGGTGLDEDIISLKSEIKELFGKVTTAQRTAVKKALSDKSLPTTPTKFKSETDIDILRNGIKAIKSVIN